MSGFVDLRLNQSAGRAEESFWPSFTDIMAVVVMIFLITTSVLILRNWELIKQITLTVEAEQRATELARTTSEEKATVEEQLADAQHRISMLRLELLRVEQERRRNQTQLAAQREEIAQLKAEQTRLQRELAQQVRGRETLAGKLDLLSEQFASLQAENESTRSELAGARRELSGTQTALAEQRSRNAQLEQAAVATSGELTALREDYDQQELELSRLRESAALVESRYASLVGQYDSLKVRYDQLIKPARTARGKYVVEVRYRKRGGAYALTIREPDEAEFRAVELTELHQTLASLRDRYPESLYVKIIFPEESGLSYAEAWSFTQDLLSRYDYYYRDR